ncbi:hypothetical protein ACAX43_31645 [Paraburkholderia sp. IW21]|uniref:hypothetical protein n=1 Tax=Paraburkholderia sp. IW21 TaxID=3242488 RepID=UPI003521098B
MRQPVREATLMRRFMWLPRRNVSAAEMVVSGEMSVPTATEYGLEEIGAAIVHAEKGGKVLLKVAS